MRFRLFRDVSSCARSCIAARSPAARWRATPASPAGWRGPAARRNADRQATPWPHPVNCPIETSGIPAPHVGQSAWFRRPHTRHAGGTDTAPRLDAPVDLDPGGFGLRLGPDVVAPLADDCYRNFIRFGCDYRRAACLCAALPVKAARAFRPTIAGGTGRNGAQPACRPSSGQCLGQGSERLAAADRQ